MRADKNIFLFILLGSILAVSVFSCSKNNSTADYNADKTALKALIDSLKSVSDSSVEGAKPGQYVTGAKTALDSVITLGEDVYAAKTYTQEQVNNAITNLRRAFSTFSSRRLQEVSAENLMGYWKFNGNTNDSSGNHNDGMMKTNWFNVVSGNPVDGGTLPQLVSDRFNHPNAACYFEKGATVEVPYSNS
nr:FIVAR domain-containing protein [Chitinophagaceae bacterium]